MGGHTPPKTAKITYQLSQFFDIWWKHGFFSFFVSVLSERSSMTYRSILNCRSWRWEIELTDYNSCRTMQKDRKWRSNQAVLSMPIPWLAGIPIPWHDEWLDKDSVILSQLNGVTVTSPLKIGLIHTQQHHVIKSVTFRDKLAKINGVL